MEEGGHKSPSGPAAEGTAASIPRGLASHLLPAVGEAGDR